MYKTFDIKKGHFYRDWKFLIASINKSCQVGNTIHIFLPHFVQFICSSILKKYKVKKNKQKSPTPNLDTQQLSNDLRELVCFQCNFFAGKLHSMKYNIMETNLLNSSSALVSIVMMVKWTACIQEVSLF